MTQFASLHVHTFYSLLDGLSSPQSLVARAKELNHLALAISDHGVMHGAVELYRECKKEGIIPIIGCEAYLKHQKTTDHLKDFVAEGDGDYRVKGKFHQLILAMNPIGYKNLVKLTSLAHLTPGRGTKSSKSETSTKSKSFNILEELEQYNEGLIVTSGCMAGIIPQALLAGDLEYAEHMAKWYVSVFGDRFYLEIQDHATNDASEQLNIKLVALAEKLGIELVATADNHYTTPCQKAAHDALLCINTGKLLSDENRMRYEGAYWLPTGDEMVERLSRYLHREVALRAVQNTVVIANRVEDYNLKGDPTPPKFTLPDEYDNADDYLEDLAYEGLRARFYGIPPQNYVERLQYELDVFRQKNLAEYFLVVGDITNFCREQGIWVGPGRGSAAGSLVSYALKITNIDPIHFGLIFSRFINPERMSYPDIDLDIDKERRHEVIEYLQQKYGSNQVAQIATFGRLVSASALKDVGRVLNVNYGAANELSTRIPVVRGKPAKLSQLIKDRDIFPEFYDAYQVDQRMPNKEGYDNVSFREWIDLAIAIEGTVKSVGIHAAGVVIGWSPLDEIVPLMKSKDGGTVCQYSMEDLEYLGLLKMDLLGLKTLSVMRRTVEAVQQLTGEQIDVESINLNDQSVLKSMVNGDNAGVFQFEADGAVRLLKQIKPTSIDDVSAITSLNRPGCLDMKMHTDYARRKAGLDRVSYLVQDLEPILSSTYGLCVFQEQMLRIFNELAGFSLGKSDNARRACLSGDTIINLSDGKRVTLRDFVQHFEAYPSVSIQCLNTETYRAVEGEVIDAMYNGLRPVYQITTKTGRKIKATTDHQFFKLDKWTSIDEGLSVGDSIAVPIEISLSGSVQSSSMSDSLIKACAYLVGDGYLPTQKDRAAYFCNSDEWLLDDFENCIKKEWGLTPKRIYQQAPHQPNPVGYVYLPKETQAVFEEKIGRCLSADRFIPEWVCQLDRRQLKVFLGSLWCTDGCFSDVPRCQGEYSSTSIKLIEELQEYFLKLGIVTTFNKKTQQYKGKPYVSYRLWVTGKEDVFAFHDELRNHLSPSKRNQLDIAFSAMSIATDNYSKYCVPAEIMHTIKELLPTGKTWRGIGIESGFGKDLAAGINFTNPDTKRGISKRRLGAFAKALNSSKLQYLATSEVLWDKIVSIDYVGIQDVYDLTIDEHHNFVANGIYVHNCGKKKKSEMEVLKPDFIQGCAGNWIDEPIADQLWEIMLASAEYTFNSSHAYCYSILTMHTAWLKHYHTSAFMAALCSMEENKKEKNKHRWDEDDEESSKLADYLIKCKSYGLKLLPPNINISSRDFIALDDSTIQWGLRSIKGLGDSALNRILLERQLAPFSGVLDFYRRTKLGCNVVKALIHAGALDCLHGNRKELEKYLELLLEWKEDCKKVDDRILKWEQEGTELIAKSQEANTEEEISAILKRMGQVEKNLLNAVQALEKIELPAMPKCQDYPLEEKLKKEKEVMGMYTSGHPLDRYPVGGEPLSTVQSKKLFVSTLQINNVRTANSKNGTMLYCEVEDKLGATMNMTVFNAQHKLYGELLKKGEHISVTAKGNEWNGQLGLVLQIALKPSKLRAEEELMAAHEDPNF